MDQYEEEILDLPDSSTEVLEESKWMRILALAFFIIAFVLKLLNWPGHGWCIIAGSFFFLLWSTLRFIKMNHRPRSEYFYLPGRLFLITGLCIRYLSHWHYDSWIVYTGLGLFIIGWILNMNDKSQ